VNRGDGGESLYAYAIAVTEEEIPVISTATKHSQERNTSGDQCHIGVITLSANSVFQIPTKLLPYRVVVCVAAIWFALSSFQPSTYKMASSAQISKKRKFIADGVFQAELGEFL
jgi:hypothetical protein